MKRFGLCVLLLFCLSVLLTTVGLSADQDISEMPQAVQVYVFPLDGTQYLEPLDITLQVRQSSGWIACGSNRLLNFGNVTE